MSLGQWAARRRRPLLAAAILAAVGLGVIMARHEPVAAPALPAALPASAAMPDVLPPTAAVGDNAPLPWQASATASATGTAPPLHQLPRQQIEQISRDPAQRAQALAQLQAQARSNEQAIDRLLLQLDQLQAEGKAPPQTAQLRAHLRDVRRAQELARELASLSTAPGSAHSRLRLEQISTELVAIKSRLANASALSLPAGTGSAG